MKGRCTILATRVNRLLEISSRLTAHFLYCNTEALPQERYV
jgi:hypothetical protein